MYLHGGQAARRHPLDETAAERGVTDEVTQKVDGDATVGGHDRHSTGSDLVGQIAEQLSQTRCGIPRRVAALRSAVAILGALAPLVEEGHDVGPDAVGPLHAFAGALVDPNRGGDQPPEGFDRLAARSAGLLTSTSGRRAAQRAAAATACAAPTAVSGGSRGTRCFSACWSKITVAGRMSTRWTDAQRCRNAFAPPPRVERPLPTLGSPMKRWVWNPNDAYFLGDVHAHRHP